MEQKEIKITVPEGYEIDKENSTFECIKFKSKTMNYNDVAVALFGNQDRVYFISASGEINSIDLEDGRRFIGDPNNAPTKRQLEKVLAYNKLLNVATYLNANVLDCGGENSSKFAIGYSHRYKQLSLYPTTSLQCSHVCFNSIELAKQAIEILGEDVVKKALGVFE